MFNSTEYLDTTATKVVRSGTGDGSGGSLEVQDHPRAVENLKPALGENFEVVPILLNENGLRRELREELIKFLQIRSNVG